MAIYVTSDLHGIDPKQFKTLLSIASFGKEDWLYVLGDVIDRGEYGVRLLNQLMNMPNAELILGNHEDMLLQCRWIFDEITAESLEMLDDPRMETLSAWLANGAQPTLKALKSLNRYSPDRVADIFDYLEDSPLYEAITIGEQDFLLVHAGLGSFSPSKKLSQYTRRELLWSRPKREDRYFENMLTIIGHTPAKFHSDSCVIKAFRTETWIDIDTSPSPMLLRLDDLSEFHL